MTYIRTLSLAVATAALLAPFSAQAAVPSGWYVGGNTIFPFQEDADSTVGATTNDIEYKSGWGLEGYTGYAWGNGIRTEAELAYRHSQVDDVDGTSSGAAGGGIHNWALMGNVLYDFETNSRFVPYVGVGIGAANVNADNMRTIVGSTFDDNRWAFAYQGIVGTAIRLEGNWDFTADYRYFRTTDVKFDENVGADRAETENGSHNLMFGIRYTFKEPQAKAPVREPMPAPAPVKGPVAPAAAAPVVAPIPQSYIVFFDFDKSALTPEASRIIAAAAEYFKSGKYVRLVVTGHTDTMGSAKYNQKLSDRRASIVQKEFERLGVPAPQVSATGMGKGSLMIPTADQVREAQNRRAEIVLQK